MIRKFVVTVCSLVLCFGAAVVSYANPATNEKPAMTETQKAVDSGNTTCPISGEPVDQDTNITYTYKGKVYKFCCSACIDEFKKDPEKYIKQMEEREMKK